MVKDKEAARVERVSKHKLSFPPCQWEALRDNVPRAVCANCGLSLQKYVLCACTIAFLSLAADLYISYTTYQEIAVFTHATSFLSHMVIALVVCYVYGYVLLTMRLTNLYTAYVMHECFKHTLRDGKSVTWIVTKPGEGILYTKTFSSLFNDEQDSL